MAAKEKSPDKGVRDRPLPLFASFARAIEQQVGRPSTFVLAVAVVLVWAISGPVFDWSDTWQLVINTGTTIVTFLMVFVIQNTQSRDTLALHLKLDELIRVTEKARDSLVGVEERSDKDIVEAREVFQELGVIEEVAVEAAARKPRRTRTPARANGSKPGSSSPGPTAPAR